ncbi:MAG: tandem-95 repeat protein [Pirellulaceae bacterium]
MADLTYSGNGQFYYVPHINYVGIDSFEYVAEDSQGGTSQVAEVTIIVNTSPEAADDFAYVSVNSDVTIDVRQANVQDGTQDHDVDGNLGDATAVIDAPDHGVLTEIAAGVFRYVPNLDFVGEDAFTYQLTDELGANSNIATVQIHVTDQLQSPVAVDDTVATREGTPRVFSVVEARTGGNDFDSDGTLDFASISVVDPPTRYSRIFGAGEFRYSPNLDFYGEDSFTYTVSDDDSQISNLATVTIQVVEANIPPLLGDRVVTVDEDSVVTFSLLADSMDLDGTLLPSSVIHVAWPSSGILRIVSTGVYSYTPNKDFHGVDSLSFQAQTT